MFPFTKCRLVILAAGLFALTASAQDPAPGPTTDRGLEFVPGRDAFGNVVWRIKSDQTAPPTSGAEQLPASGVPAITFEVYQDDFRQYRWRMKGPAGRTVAASVEGYRTRDEANRMIQTIRTGAPQAKLDDKTR